MPHCPATLQQMTFLPYDKEMEALWRRAPQLLATKSTNPPTSTPTPWPKAKTSLPGFGALPSSLSCMFCIFVSSFYSKNIGKITSLLCKQTERKKGLLVTLQTSTLGSSFLSSWPISPHPPSLFSPFQSGFCLHPFPPESPISMPLSPAGISCHIFGPLGTPHPAPVSVTLCSY